MPLHAGGAIVVWHGKLFLNSSCYQCYGEHPPFRTTGSRSGATVYYSSALHTMHDDKLLACRLIRRCADGVTLAAQATIRKQRLCYSI